MRLALTFSAVVLAVATSGQALAQATGIFDQNWASVQRQMATEQRQQCGRMSFIAQSQCYENVRQQIVQQGDVPGTDPYVQKHYGYMGAQELNQQIIRLNGTYGVARHIYPGQHTPPGEISFEQIQYDINAIRQLIRIRGGLSGIN